MSYLKNLRTLRLKRGLTQPEVADLVGVTVGTINLWEKQTNGCNAQHLADLARIFNVEPGYLLGIQGARKQVSQQEQEKT